MGRISLKCEVLFDAIDTPEQMTTRVLGVPSVLVGGIGTLVVIPPSAAKRGTLRSAEASARQPIPAVGGASASLAPQPALVQLRGGAPGSSVLGVTATPALAELLTYPHDDGSWSVMFRGETPGEHALAVTLDDRPVPGSPFLLRILGPTDGAGANPARLARALARLAAEATARRAAAELRVRALALGSQRRALPALCALKAYAAECGAQAAVLARPLRLARLEHAARDLWRSFLRWSRIGGYTRTMRRTQRTRKQAGFDALGVAGERPWPRLRAVADSTRRRHELWRLRDAVTEGRGLARRLRKWATRTTTGLRLGEYGRRGRTLQLWRALSAWIVAVGRGGKVWKLARFSERRRGRVVRGVLGEWAAETRKRGTLAGATVALRRAMQRRTLDDMRWGSAM
ncbi:hypothetical protein T492DRAFT_847245 [Pavlovales sp. CCMP2436]|nr:hypothetical protein T492DRAFT_847245 [Pavlovales sp. CCMP2436]